MKTMRNLFLLCAGLSLFACSSDDDATQQFPEGNGAVTIKIVDPSSRAITNGSGESKITVNGDIYVTLTYTLEGQQTSTKKITYDSQTDKYSVDGNEFAQGNPEVTFYNIGTPNSVAVSMNGGVSSYDDIAINGNTSYSPGGNFTIVTGNMQADPASIPVYNSTETYRKTGEVIKNGEIEYIEYESTVDLNGTIPVARLEVQIEAGTEILTGSNNQFGSVSIQGVYLDDILVKPTDEKTTNYYLTGDQSATKKADQDDEGQDLTAILADTYESPYYSFSSGTFAPAKVAETSQYYAYNFYPASTAPKFKLCLNVTKANGATDEIPTTQYAIISGYTYGSDAPEGKTEGTEVTFEKGYIYTIKALKLNADNIQVDEEGQDLAYALTAIVTRAQWTPLVINGSWD